MSTISIDKKWPQRFSKMAREVIKAEKKIMKAYAKEVKKPIPDILAKRYTLPKQRMKKMIQVQMALAGQAVALKFVRTSKKKGQTSPPNLTAYPGTEEKWRGIWFKVLQAGGRKTIKGGFIRKIRGNPIAMRRKQHSTYYTGKRAHTYRWPPYKKPGLRQFAFAQMEKAKKYPTTGMSAVSLGAMGEKMFEPIYKNLVERAFLLTDEEMRKILE